MIIAMNLHFVGLYSIRIVKPFPGSLAVFCHFCFCRFREAGTLIMISEVAFIRADFSQRSRDTMVQNNTGPLGQIAQQVATVAASTDSTAAENYLPPLNKRKQKDGEVRKGPKSIN